MKQTIHATATAARGPRGRHTEFPLEPPPAQNLLTTGLRCVPKGVVPSKISPDSQIPELGQAAEIHHQGRCCSQSLLPRSVKPDSRERRPAELRHPPGPMSREREKLKPS